MMLDISHAINQFIDDLPDNLADFKNVVQTTFPNLVDTKLMSCQLPFRELMKSSVLTDVMKRLETEPFTLEGLNKTKHVFLSKKLTFSH